MTSGYGAHGVVLQSIGGGGGQGGDGSDTSGGTIGLGGGAGGSGGSSGTGGAVIIETGSSAGINISGDDAYGILAQSIGGGGGVAGAGSSTKSGSVTDGNYSFNVAVGGKGGSTGDGGTVDISMGGSINTSGARSFGIVAQSIGGGGGIGGAASSASLASVAIGGDGSNGGSSDTVTVNYLGNLSTTGDGSVGIIAQSIGGGGGIGGDASGTIKAFDGFLSGQTGGLGNGNNVSVTVSGTLTTAGANAHGIIAQAIAGGGGLIGTSSGVEIGSARNPDSETSGTVTVTQSGALSTSGTGSIGIFAQSQALSPEAVTVNVGGSVTGGPGGTGVFVSGGFQNVLNFGQGASVSAGGQQSYAVGYKGSYPAQDGAVLDIYNSGTINGDIFLVDGNDDTAGTLYNSGQWNPDSASSGNLFNGGTVDISSAPADAAVAAPLVAGGETGPAAKYGQVSITGDFTQTRTGRLIVGTDFAAGRGDSLAVGGRGRLGGTVVIDADTLLKSAYVPIISSDGALTGSIDAVDTRAVNFDTRVLGRRVAVTIADTRFGAAFDTLTTSERSAGGHLDAIFDNRSRRYAELLAQMNVLAEQSGDGGAYAQALTSLTPGASQAMAAAQVALTKGRLDGAMHCPTQIGTPQTVDEDGCAWASGGGSYADQSGTNGYDGSMFGFSGGAQFSFNDNWIWGLGAGYEHSSYDGNNGISRVDGDTGFLAIALGRRFGDFTLSGAVAGSWGEFDTDRQVMVPGFVGTATGGTDVGTLSARIRAAYTMSNALGYVTPILDLDLVHTRAGGYTENGAGLFNLDVNSEAKTALVVTPSVEFGISHALQGGWAVGASATVGVSLSTEDDWSTSASLVAAPDGAGEFSTSLPIPTVLGRLGFGVSLANVDAGFEAKLEYNAALGDDYQSYGGMFRLEKRF